MRKLIYIFTVAVLAALVYSCSTTRRIPDDEFLYTGLKGVDIDADSLPFPADLREVLTQAVDVAPTEKTWYVLPLGLWVYNNWSDTTSALGKRLYDKWVKDPVLVSDVRPQLRVRMLDRIMANNGYFNASADYELIHPKNPKKAKILYHINAGRPATIDSLILLPDTSVINCLIDSVVMRDSYLSRILGVPASERFWPGSRTSANLRADRKKEIDNEPVEKPRFSLDSLSAARERISTRMRNRGYYYFSPDFIEYLADTVMIPGKVVMKLDLAANIPAFAREKYYTGDVTVRTWRYRGGGEPDTFKLEKVTLVQMMPSRLRHSIFTDNVTFRHGRTFSTRQMDNTQSYLSRLGIFSSIDMTAVRDTSAARPTLNVNIDATFDAPLEVSIEANATSKSNSYLGPGLSFGVTNHNVFGGGEQLSVQFTGSYEWQTGHGSNRSIFNSYEFGLQGSLAFPRMLAPEFIPRRHRQLNWTRITLNADLLNRPHFFKMAQFNSSLSYDWASSRYVSNKFTPLKLTYTRLQHTTEVFDSIMTANPAIALSFQNQFIPQMSYGITYDRAFDRDNRLNVQVQAIEAGNLFWSIYSLCGVDGEKRLLGTPFSQFIKGQAQLVWAHRTLGDSWLVSRVAVGAAHAYGNSSQVPYSEQFYCGGANSVRAFSVRSIGPGSYHDPAHNDTYFDQTGTFKFEANVEYRFPIYGPLNGAFFLDAGNVWLLKNESYRPGGQLEARNFLRELATGTGAGIRFDIGMLVLRGDLGIGIHAPYDTGKSGYYNMTSFGHSLAFHLAIGYPF